MSSNYGYDANGWEREPFPARDEHEPERRRVVAADTPHRGICSTCAGQGCEEGCGRCEMAYAGPDSHKVCRDCKGVGR